MTALIKVCGARDPLLVQNAAKLGADFIGINLSSTSKRCVDLALAKELVAATREGGAIPVLVVTDHTEEELLHALTITMAPCVQLHGNKVRAFSENLPEAISQIFVVPVSDNGLLQYSEAQMKHLQRERDYLLFDSVHPGTGRSLHVDAPMVQQFAALRQMRFLIAGGLNPNNVCEAIEQYDPSGVDACSGLESAGKKDLSLIEAFINQVKPHVVI